MLFCWKKLDIPQQVISANVPRNFVWIRAFFSSRASAPCKVSAGLLGYTFVMWVRAWCPSGTFSSQEISAGFKSSCFTLFSPLYSVLPVTISFAVSAIPILANQTVKRRRQLEVQIHPIRCWFHAFSVDQSPQKSMRPFFELYEIQKCQFR